MKKTRSCPSQCLTKGTISLTSSLEVPEGALHPADATVDASGAHNGVANYWGVPQQCEEHDRLNGFALMLIHRMCM